jgi:energy-coupling factor transporter ATP-binding protein EcfA2
MTDSEKETERTFQLNIPMPQGALIVDVKTGTSAIFVGANGGGKTRLAVLIEQTMGDQAHRISAHRALALNPSVPKITERQALAGLRTGYPHEDAVLGHRSGIRWQSKEAVSLLNDFDFLVQALFADQANKSLETHKKNRAGDTTKAEPTKFEELVEIWQRLLPHCHLHISGDDIEVSISPGSARYKASEMSDGERAIFYMIGQALTAAENTLLLVDEPELHVHRSIMARLWDELEAARQDCAFVYITHDLEFAAARAGQKFIISAYDPKPNWTIEPVPQDTGFSEELTTLILGSRRPVLFTEGENSSLDVALYRACYPGWTVIPRGSCENVIHSVVTMRRNKELTRVMCTGLVDADDNDADDVKRLADLGVQVLPVSEIENLFLLPDLSRAILDHEGFSGAALDARLGEIQKKVFATLANTASVDELVLRYCKRRIDRNLKKIDLSGAATESQLATEYAQKVAAVDIQKIAQVRRTAIQNAIQAGDLPALLQVYDNKGLLALAASQLKTTPKDAFEGWLARVLINGKVPKVVAAVRAVLPKITAK